jgi:hypothetical protein
VLNEVCWPMPSKEFQLESKDKVLNINTGKNIGCQ